jgi:hypothetical protein
MLHVLLVSRKSSQVPLDQEVLSILYLYTEWRKSHLVSFNFELSHPHFVEKYWI